MKMENNQKILEYRERLNKTLASHNLVNDECLKTLVKNQLTCSTPLDSQGNIESLVGKITADVANFLDMLRSASGNDGDLSRSHGTSQRDWKLKHDNDVYRVMYREGPEGTPFHTLLVEGYADGPVDVCLCLSWESGLFNRWWPQFSIPPFKLASSSCLQKIRIGEQLCLVRVKVAWPLSAREVILHYFEVEYFEEDLVLVLLNTISDAEAVDECTHGFTRDCIPEAKDIVRIDLVGGFVLQKITSDRSYFRTIANMDTKLDFVPPSLINFVSRQLIGSGFKLYQKTVAAIAKGDEEFRKALEDPLYVRVREGLYHAKKLEKAEEQLVLESDESISTCCEEVASEAPHDDAKVVEDTPFSDSDAIGSSEAGLPIAGPMSHSEIREEVEEETYRIKGDGEIIKHSFADLTADQRVKENNIHISPEVQNALRILDNAISMVRTGEFDTQKWSIFGSTNQERRNLERVAIEVGSTSSADKSDGEGNLNAKKAEDIGRNLERVAIEVGSTSSADKSDGEGNLNAKKAEDIDKASDEVENSSDVLHVRHDRAESPVKEVHHNRIAPAASPILNSTIPNNSQENVWSSSKNGITLMKTPVLDNMSKECEEDEIKINGTHENNGENIKQRKWSTCCFYASRG